MPRQPWRPGHLAPCTPSCWRSAPWVCGPRRMDRACAVRHSVVASPLGQIRISGCQQGLQEIKLPAAGPPEAPAPPEPPGRPAETAKPLAECAAWLHAYFQEPAALRELPVPALHHPVFLQDSFTGQVLRKLLEAVKFGEVVSYQQLAALAGNPKAARAVGGAMRSNPAPILVPCHRVVCSGGALGNYSGGLGVKEWLLDHEGSLAGTPARAGGSRLARTRCGALRGSSSSESAGGDGASAARVRV